MARLLAVFLKIGSIGFGGGMAVISLMEREFVGKRKLLAADEFLQGIGLGQILGSFAVNAAFFTGYRLLGTLGGILSPPPFCFRPPHWSSGFPASTSATTPFRRCRGPSPDWVPW